MRATLQVLRTNARLLAVALLLIVVSLAGAMLIARDTKRSIADWRDDQDAANAWLASKEDSTRAKVDSLAAGQWIHTKAIIKLKREVKAAEPRREQDEHRSRETPPHARHQAPFPNGL